MAQSLREPSVRTIWPDAQDGTLVSPDGKRIAFIDWNYSEVAVRDVATGVERRLPDAASVGFPEPYFAFSPDSNALAFAYGNNRDAAPFRYELRAIDLRDGAHTVLATFEPDVALVVPLTWHAAAGILYNTVAANGSSELRLLNPATKTGRVVHRRASGAGLAWQADFARDGSGIAILANDELVWIDMASSTSHELGMPAQILLGWSGDDRALLFHGARDHVMGIWSVAVSQGRLAGTPTLLRRTAAGVRGAGRTVEGMHYLEPAQTPGLVLAAIDIGAATVIARPQSILPAPGRIAGNPAWSRDGSRLAFTLAVSNRIANHVFVVDGPHGTPREIATVDFRAAGLDWSADGKFLITGGRADTRNESWVGRIDVATGAIEKLVTGTPANAVAAGAGEQIVFSRAALPGTRSVHVMHLQRAGAGPRILATYTTADLPRSLSISPDGQWVAILKSLPEAPASALVVLPIAGGEPRTVLQVQRPDSFELNQGRVPWTPDGRSVLVLMRRAGKRQIAAVRIDSGAISALPVAPQQGGRRSLALHPDGHQLLYVDGAGRDELRLMMDARRN
jgi:Tol biopolymer transport system component